MRCKRAVYHAVFPGSAEADSPTPTATPLIDAGLFDVSHNISQEPDKDDIASASIRWRRAWHAATSYLTLSRASISRQEASQVDRLMQGNWFRQCSTEVSAAIAFLVRNHTSTRVSSRTGGLRKLVDWYSQEVTNHFLDSQLPLLHKMMMLKENQGSDQLSELVQMLQAVQTVYFSRLESALFPHLKNQGHIELSSFRERHHALVARSLTTPQLSAHISNFFNSKCDVLFQAPWTMSGEENMDIDLSAKLESATVNIKEFLKQLNEVGLGGAPLQRILAEIIDDRLMTHMASGYSDGADSEIMSAEKLHTWVEECLTPLVTSAITCLHPMSQPADMSSEKQLPDEMITWKERVTHELAALRLEEAFDIVLNWQHNMSGCLNDMVPYTRTMAGRAFLANKFSTVIGYRLLQPGASTIEILQVYTHIIMAFLELDAKGVLLDRVSRPLRRYLRERSDTVRTIIQGLLLDPSNGLEDHHDPMHELARVLTDLQEQQNPDDEVDGDLYDLRWEPDPVDATAEYKAEERGEIIGSLIDIFENKDIFVKEFQSMLGDNLLQNDRDFQREIQVLELFKKRMGESHLQACEVMLKDVNDSRRMDDLMAREQRINFNHTSFRTKILSRLYWPSFPAEEFKIPDQIQRLEEKFSAGFEHYKPSRKLTWIHKLGQAKVVLQLKDRTVEEDVHTWQACVINAFAQSECHTNGQATMTASDISAQLDMSEGLVQEALGFWVGKLVLQVDGANYCVMEELPSGVEMSNLTLFPGGDLSTTNPATGLTTLAGVEARSGMRSGEQILEEKMAVFWPFIMNMLKNQGAMPLPKIVMMLKFVVQGGFPHTHDELREFLARRVGEGQLELSGGNYKMATGS